MAVVGGIILWVSLIGLMIGYVVVKKLGDKRKPLNNTQIHDDVGQSTVTDD